MPGLTTAWCALKVTVCVPVQVRSWSWPESHVAGSQCSWATEGAEAEYPSGKEVQPSRPQQDANPAAP
jgi:hypothetical protein